MRWGAHRFEFVRPVHWLVALFGDAVQPCEVFGIPAGNRTRGHRFHADREIALDSPEGYEQALAEAWVVADFERRRGMIREQVAVELERRKPRYGPVPPPKTDGCPACAGKHRAHTCVQGSATKSTSAKSNEREGGGLTTVPLPSQSADVSNPAMRSFLGR